MQVKFSDDFEVEDLGIKEEYVYDIEVENDHNFFGNNICVHNSTYAEIESIVNYKWPDITDSKLLVDKIDEFAINTMGPYIDERYKELSSYFNSDHLDKLDMKREAIADKFYIRAKKNYIMRVLDNEGIRYADPYYKFMGIESVRTSHPIMVRTAIEDVMKIIIEGTNKEVRDYVSKFKKEYMNSPLKKIGSPRGVSDIDKYSTKDHTFKTDVTIPIHVRAAVNYNRLVSEHKLSNKHEYIKGGSKIKFLPLKEENPIRSHVIGFIDELPEEFGLENYIDKESHFNKTFIGPIMSFMIFNGWTLEENTLLDVFGDSINIAEANVAVKSIDKTKVIKETTSLF